MSAESATAGRSTAARSHRLGARAHGRAGGRPLARTARRHRRLRSARRRDPSGLRPADGQHRAAPHPGAARAGRRSRRRGLRRGIQQDRRRDRDLRPRRDQPRHRDRRRLHGLGADRLHHRSGVLEPDGHRRLPGGRHRRHHDADHEALVPGEATPRTSPARSPRPSRSPAPAAPAPCSWTSRRTRSRPRRRSSGRPRSTCPATAR